MTARVIETQKLCRPRALTGAAAAEGSSGGVRLAKKSAWKRLREASHVRSIQDRAGSRTQTQKGIHGACPWHRFCLARLAIAGAGRSGAESSVKKAAAQWTMSVAVVWAGRGGGYHGKPDGNLARLPRAREVRAHADAASWAPAKPRPRRKLGPGVCSAELPRSFCLSEASYQILLLEKKEGDSESDVEYLLKHF